MGRRNNPRTAGTATAGPKETPVAWTMYAAPAGLESYGIQEGDRLSLNREAEGLFCTFEVPLSILSQLGAPVAVIEGVVRLPD